MNTETCTTLTDAATCDIALALIMEFGAIEHIHVDGDELELSFEIGHGAALSVHVFGSDTFNAATIMMEELRFPVRALRGTKNGDQVAKACRRAVDAWIAKHA